MPEEHPQTHLKESHNLSEDKEVLLPGPFPASPRPHMLWKKALIYNLHTALRRQVVYRPLRKSIPLLFLPPTPLLEAPPGSSILRQVFLAAPPILLQFGKSYILHSYKTGLPLPKHSPVHPPAVRCTLRQLHRKKSAGLLPPDPASPPKHSSPEKHILILRNSMPVSGLISHQG